MLSHQSARKGSWHHACCHARTAAPQSTVMGCRFIASGSLDRTLMLWNPFSQQPLSVLQVSRVMTNTLCSLLCKRYFASYKASKGSSTPSTVLCSCCISCAAHSTAASLICDKPLLSHCWDTPCHPAVGRSSPLHELCWHMIRHRTLTP